MMKKRFTPALLMLSASLLTLSACQTTSPGPVQPLPSVQPSPSVSPEPEPSPSLSPEPSVEPTASVAPSPDSSASPDTSVIDNTTFNGKVFDDQQNALDGVTIAVRSLSSQSDYQASTITAGGTYALNNAPAGIQLEITASKPGMTTRRRVEVLKSNKQGDPAANRYDFGTDGSSTSFGVAHQALSDRPEVMQISPGRQAADIAANTPIVLTFSEPMDQASVLDTLQIRAFSSRSLSIDDGVSLTGAGSLATPAAGSLIYDKNAFEASWNAEDTVLTLNFKDQRALPADRDSAHNPDYLVSFVGGTSEIKDKAGIARGSAYFKLSDGPFENASRFAIQTDSIAPQLTQLQAHTAENGGIDGDALRVRYSERMIHYTLGPSLAGGINGNAGQAAAAVGSVSAEQAATNYRISVRRGGQQLMQDLPWSALGGRASFDTLDPTHRTVRLLPPGLALSTGQQNVGASANAAQAITGSIYYQDGSQESLNVTPAANTWPALKNALDSQLSGSPFSVTEIANGNGNVDAGDSYHITLQAGAENLAGNKTVALVVLNPSGAFASAHLNAPAGGLRLYPGAAPNTPPNLFQPGDQITVKAASTVLDPAGNSLQSSPGQLSVTAS